METNKSLKGSPKTVRAHGPIGTQPPHKRRIPVPIALVIVIDATGSMANEIAGVIEALFKMLAMFAKESIDATLALVVYRDELCGEKPVVVPMGSSPESIQAELRRTVADGGGDDPESAYPALALALFELGKASPQAKPYILHITDAPPHDPESGHTAASILQALKDKKVIYFSCTPPIQPYRNFADVTGGTLFPLMPDLDPETFQKMLMDVARQTTVTARKGGPVLTADAIEALKHLSRKA